MRHDPAIRSFALVFDQPFAWETFSAALDLLSRLVFITRNIPRETVEQLFAAVGALRS